MLPGLVGETHKNAVNAPELMQEADKHGARREVENSGYFLRPMKNNVGEPKMKAHAADSVIAL